MSDDYTTNTTSDKPHPCLQCGADVRFYPCCARAAALTAENARLTRELGEAREAIASDERTFPMLVELWRLLSPQSTITNDTLPYVQADAKKAIADAQARIARLRAEVRCGRLYSRYVPSMLEHDGDHEKMSDYRTGYKNASAACDAHHDLDEPTPTQPEERHE